MTLTEFSTYKSQINSDYHDLVMDLCNKYDIFSKDLNKYKKRVKIAQFIIKYINEDLQVTSTNGFSINILTIPEVINLSETLNKLLGTRYKPTFLTDVENYKSIRETF